jgi:hypothetical protein
VNALWWQEVGLDPSEDHNLIQALENRANDELWTDLWGTNPEARYPVVEVKPETTLSDATVFGRAVAVERSVGKKWLVQARLAETRDRVVVVRDLTVHPWPPDHMEEVAGAVLKGINVREIRDRAIRYLRHDAETLRWQVDRAAAAGIRHIDADRLAPLEEAVAKLPARRRPGRPPTAREDLEQLVHVWHELKAEGYGRRGKALYPEIARRLKINNLRTVADRLHRAREAGLLPRAPQGRRAEAP